MVSKILSAIAISLLSIPCFGQQVDTAKLNQYFHALDSTHQFMGGVALLENGEIVYTHNTGFADVAQSEKAQSLTEYRIGSISKTFTSVLIFKSIEDGKLKLEDKLAKYFPSIPNSNDITIEALLRHRSGIHNFTDDADYMNWNTKSKSKAEMIDIIAKGGSDFKPDSTSEYSNSNYVLLSFILEKIWNQPYGEILEDKILKPVGLQHTHFNQKNINLAKSYTFTDKHWEEASITDISIPMGAGGISATPSDLVKFSNALFNGKLLKQGSLLQMETIKDHFGMGLFQFPFNEQLGFGHTGGIDGYASLFGQFNKDNVSFAVIGNGVNYNINNIAIALLSAAYKLPFTIPTIIEVPDSLLDQYTGEYSNDEIGMKIVIVKDGGTLTAQASGQSAFPLTSVSADKFTFDEAGITIQFNRQNHSFEITQGGGTVIFKK